MTAEDKQFQFWQKWLTYVNIFCALMGLLVALAGDSIIFNLHNSATNDVFFNGAGINGGILLLKKWLFGIIGGTMFGFHILLVFVSENAFKNKEVWAFNAVAIATITWFVIDSSLSFYYGAVHNIIQINLVALVLIGLPLIITRKHFVKIN